MIVAAIDIGTNSTRLLIAEYDSQKGIREITKQKITNRMGQGIDSNHCLKKEALNSLLSALKYFVNLIEKHKVEKTTVVGTSALRDVINKEEIIKKVKQETDLNLKVISGQKEAELVKLGVSSDLQVAQDLIIDIGGGSTELVWQENKQLKIKSFNMGAVRFTDKYIENPEKPLKLNQIEEIKTRIAGLLKEKIKNKFSKKEAIGVGGTITTLAAIKLEINKYNTEMIHGCTISRQDVDESFVRLAGLNLVERQEIVGLEEKRADIIPAGVLILKELMLFFNIKSLLISERDILFGIIYDLVSQE